MDELIIPSARVGIQVVFRRTQGCVECDGPNIAGKLYIETTDGVRLCPPVHLTIKQLRELEDWTREAANVAAVKRVVEWVRSVDRDPRTEAGL